MQKERYLWYLLGALSLCLLIFSTMVEPTSYLHDYYIMAAKHWDSGLTPWLGFDLIEMPCGIGMLNLIPDIEHHSFSARLLVLFFNIVNIGLLGAILTKLKTENPIILSGCILYTASLASFGCLGVTLEPFGITFLLSAYFGYLSHQKIKNILAGLLLAVAVLFKAEILFFAPCLALLTALPSKHHHLHLSRTFLSLLITTFILLISYMLVTIWSVNTEWLTSLDITPLKESHQAIAWSMFFLSTGFFILLFFVGSTIKKKKIRNLRKSALLGVAILLALMLIGCNRSCLQILLPINTIAITTILQEKWESPKTRSLYMLGIGLVLLYSTVILYFSPSVGKNNPLLETFKVNYQLQQEIKTPDTLQDHYND